MAALLHVSTYEWQTNTGRNIQELIYHDKWEPSAYSEYLSGLYANTHKHAELENVEIH